MKNYYIFFSLLLITICLKINSQTKKRGQVIYTIENNFGSINNEKEKSLSPGLEKIFSRLKKTSKNVEFSLHFNNLESKFKIKDAMLIDINDRSLSKLLDNGVFYLDNNGNVIQKVELSGEIYLVVDSLKNKNWKLINETKKIGKYLCYKAITKKIVKTNKTHIKNVTAWYCPEIPYTYGQDAYGGWSSSQELIGAYWDYVGDCISAQGNIEQPVFL